MREHAIEEMERDRERLDGFGETVQRTPRSGIRRASLGPSFASRARVVVGAQPAKRRPGATPSSRSRVHSPDGAIHCDGGAATALRGAHDDVPCAAVALAGAALRRRGAQPHANVALAIDVYAIHSHACATSTHRGAGRGLLRATYET